MAFDVDAANEVADEAIPRVFAALDPARAGEVVLYDSFLIVAEGTKMETGSHFVRYFHKLEDGSFVDMVRDGMMDLLETLQE